MNHALKLQIRNIEGALIRALGTAERRGFRVLGVELNSRKADFSQLFLTVHSADRCVQQLKHQLERLHDITDVSIIAEPVVLTAAAGV